MNSVDQTIRWLSQRFASSAEDADRRAAAAATGGVPVYADMGGLLVVLSDRRVVHYDPQTLTVREVEEPRWRYAALIKAARTFPELSSLLPSRPENAITCTACRGAGTLFGVGCGTCFGTGWLD